MAHIESRLDRLPIFRSKLPLELDYLHWVEDENFGFRSITSATWHFQKPGDWRQFCIQASRIHARPLDLNRPLWEIYVMEGLGIVLTIYRWGSFALLIKIHHAAIDVEHGSEISMLLHDLSPIPPKVQPPKLGLQRAGLPLLQGISKTVRYPPPRGLPINRSLSRLGPIAVNFFKDMVLKPEFMTSSRFNSVVSPYRVFDTRRFGERVQGY